MTRDQLRVIRGELGLTQNQMAAGLGLSPRGYQKIENGETGLRRLHDNAVKWFVSQQPDGATLLGRILGDDHAADHQHRSGDPGPVQADPRPAARRPA